MRLVVRKARPSVEIPELQSLLDLVKLLDIPVDCLSNLVSHRYRIKFYDKTDLCALTPDNAKDLKEYLKRSMTGTVSAFNHSTGIGTVIGEDGRTYDLHYTDILKPVRAVSPGDKVLFVPNELSNTREALEVKKFG